MPGSVAKPKGRGVMRKTVLAASPWSKDEFHKQIPVGVVKCEPMKKKPMFVNCFEWKNGKKITWKEPIGQFRKKKRTATNIKKELLDDDISFYRKIELIKKLMWEFLRRNREYKKDHAEWLNLTSPTPENVQSGYRRLAEKWRMPPFDPTQKECRSVAPNDPKYSDYRLCSLRDAAAVQFMASPESIVKFNWATKEGCEYPPKENPHKYDGTDFLGNVNPHDMKQINLTINLLYPKSDILAAIEGVFLRFHKKHATERLPNTRKRLDKYFDLLKVYDLKESGKTYQEIIDALHLKSKTGSDVLMTQVSREYRKAVRLIKGGYEQIR